MVDPIEHTVVGLADNVPTLVALNATHEIVAAQPDNSFAELDLNRNVKLPSGAQDATVPGLPVALQ